MHGHTGFHAGVATHTAREVNHQRVATLSRLACNHDLDLIRGETLAGPLAQHVEETVASAAFLTRDETCCALKSARGIRTSEIAQHLRRNDDQIRGRHRLVCTQPARFSGGQGRFTKRSIVHVKAKDALRAIGTRLRALHSACTHEVHRIRHITLLGNHATRSQRLKAHRAL